MGARQMADFIKSGFSQELSRELRAPAEPTANPYDWHRINKPASQMDQLSAAHLPPDEHPFLKGLERELESKRTIPDNILRPLLHKISLHTCMTTESGKSFVPTTALTLNPAPVAIFLPKGKVRKG